LGEVGIGWEMENVTRTFAVKYFGFIFVRCNTSCADLVMFDFEILDCKSTKMCLYLDLELSVPPTIYMRGKCSAVSDFARSVFFECGDVK
jgi:hypothetical protein